MSVWDKINFDEFTGENKPVDPKLKRLLTKSHNKIVQLDKLHKSKNRIEKLKDNLESRTFEQRSKWSKKGWNKEVGYEERREHIINQAELNKEDNIELLAKYNQDSIHQAKAGSIGGKIAGPVVANRVHHCKYCEIKDIMNWPYNNYHGEKCKKNPNRVIIYKYELVMDGKSVVMFEEKQDIAKHLKCSAALISKYMSGKKKDIKGYQIKTII